MRTVTEIQEDGSVIITEREVNWNEVRDIRFSYLQMSDLWMLADRYAELSVEQQQDLVAYRQALRDITDFETANEAADNFPIPPDWMI